MFIASLSENTMYVHVSLLAIGTPEFSIDTMDGNHMEGIFVKEYTLYYVWGLTLWQADLMY